MTEEKSPTMKCVICGSALYLEGDCVDQKDHWRHMSPEEIKGALEKLQSEIFKLLNILGKGYQP